MNFDESILAAIVPLRAAGFALHWLHARDKAPIGKGWSDAPVATLDELHASHRAKNNLGVRLGEPSHTADGYLNCFDIDIRLPDLATEAWAAFRALLPGVDPDNLPTVASGSGGESRHKFFVTDRPFHGRKVAVSEGKHRSFDKKLGREVWHYDWEIELFGTGKQVVLPPSIHPETRLPYQWLREFDFTDFELPGISSAIIESLGVAETATYEFEEREPLTFKEGQLDRVLTDVPDAFIDDYHHWITLGQALHHQFGGSDAGYALWIKQSQRSDKFDATGGRELLRKWRGFGKNRRKPVTMASVVEWAQNARVAAYADAFDDIPEPVTGPCESAGTPAFDDDFDDLSTPQKPSDISDFVDDFDDLSTTPAPAPAASGGLDDFDAPLTEVERLMQRELGWVSLLDVNEEGAVKPTLHNLRLIVENDTRFNGVMAFNEFTQEVVQRGVPGTKSGRERAAKPTLQLGGMSFVVRDPVNGDFWTEDKDNAIRAVIEAPKTQGGYGIKVPDRDLRAAIDLVGRLNCFHPVREYLSALTWDGKSRVETLFSDYLGAPDDVYHRAAARIMLVAAVARVHEPGSKFDAAVILEGLQGKRKSTFISILAKSWFVELDCDITDTKAVVELLQGAWIVELNELGGLTKADVRHVKAFISRRSDKVRLAYAKRAMDFQRQSILIGSTNDNVYLKDSTGGRRFLPVHCAIEGEIDTDRLSAEIDQIWAEALVIFRQMRVEQPFGTLPLYLSDPEARATAEALQESRQVESTESALAGKIAEWLDKPINSGAIDEDLDQDGRRKVRTEVCLLEIWTECFGKEESAYVAQWPATLGRAMRMVPDWQEMARRSRFGRFGQQRGFERSDRVKRLGLG